MSEDNKKTKKKRKTPPEKKVKEFKEKMEKLKEEGYSGSPSGPLGQTPLMHRMSGLQGGPESRMMLKAIRDIQSEIYEIKTYLQEITEILKSRDN